MSEPMSGVHLNMGVPFEVPRGALALPSIRIPRTAPRDLGNLLLYRATTVLSPDAAQYAFDSVADLDITMMTYQGSNVPPPEAPISFTSASHIARLLREGDNLTLNYQAPGSNESPPTYTGISFRLQDQAKGYAKWKPTQVWDLDQ